MIFKLGDISFRKPPETISVQSPQKTAEIELPDIVNVIQDFGPGSKRFSFSGIFKKSEQPLDKILQLDDLKNQGEDFIFAIDRFSRKVHFQLLAWDFIRGGHIRYSIELVETEEPATFIYTPAPELSGPDKMDYYIAQLKARAKAFKLQNALWQIYNSINYIDQYLANVRSVIRDVRTLSELPANLINRLKFELSMIILHAEIIKLEAKKLIDTPARTYSAFEEMLKFVYQYAQLVLTESELMWTRANALPKKEKTHIVAAGNTLQSISQKYYGSVSSWTDIAYANKIVDPTLIKIGDILVILA